MKLRTANQEPITCHLDTIILTYLDVLGTEFRNLCKKDKKNKHISNGKKEYA